MSEDEFVLRDWEKEKMDASRRNTEINSWITDAHDEGYDDGFDDGYGSGIHQNQIEVVKNMLKKNIDLNIISEVTNLSIDEVKEIGSE